MKCRYKEFFIKNKPEMYGGMSAECEHTRDINWCFNRCGFYEKYQDLAIDAQVEMSIEADDEDGFRGIRR